MNEYEKDAAVDKFISYLQNDFYNIQKMCKFIKIDDDRYKKLVDESLDLIDSKIKDVINSKSIDDVKKHVKLKKLLKKKFGE